jgi:hypothetical protein
MSTNSDTASGQEWRRATAAKRTDASFIAKQQPTNEGRCHFGVTTL